MKNLGYKQWIEDNLRLVDKNNTLVDFRLNPIQQRYLTEDMTGKDIILKARQQGFSSLILAIFLADFLLKENTYNLVVADTVENAQGLLKRVKDYLVEWGETNGVDASKVLKYNSKYELYMESSKSTYHIGTAQNTHLGRSKTITNLHLSEAAFYPNVDDILAGAMQAVIPSGRVIIETTANGFNTFKSYWDKTSRKETPFANHFYPGSAFYSEAFLKEKKAELGRLFKQEYPETAMEAFLTSGNTYFDMDALNRYQEMIREPLVEDGRYVYV